MNYKKYFKVLAAIMAACVFLGAIVAACAPADPALQSNQAGGINTQVVATTWEYNDDGSPFTWPDFLGWVFLIGAVVVLGFHYLPPMLYEYKKQGSSTRTWIATGILMILFCFTTAIVVVPVTTVAVIRQVMPATNYYVLGPGTHIVAPVVSTVNFYTTRIRPMKVFDITADSNSTGRPEVYPDVVVWFKVPQKDGANQLDLTNNPADENALLRLDLQYGPEYEKSFVLEQAIASVKEIAGSHAYDYFGNQRAEAQEAIQTLLQSKLGSLVTVEDMTISTYSYSNEFQAKLDDLAMKQVELERAMKDVSIADQRRLEQEMRSQQRRLEGEGEKDYQISIAQGKAESLRLIAEQLAANPLVIQYEQLQKWGGVYPYFYQYSESGAPSNNGTSGIIIQMPALPTPVAPITTTTVTTPDH